MPAAVFVPLARVEKHLEDIAVHGADPRELLLPASRGEGGAIGRPEGRPSFRTGYERRMRGGANARRLALPHPATWGEGVESEIELVDVVLAVDERRAEQDFAAVDDVELAELTRIDRGRA